MIGAQIAHLYFLVTHDQMFKTDEKDCDVYLARRSRQSNMDCGLRFRNAFSPNLLRVALPGIFRVGIESPRGKRLRKAKSA